jgi:YD repeat-containing protein
MIDPDFDPSTIPFGRTRDHNGRLLSYRGGYSGRWYAYTRDDAGRVLTYRDSSGCRSDYTYDADGKCTVTRTQEVPYAA